MALIDDIEFFGRAVATGDMDRADAIAALVTKAGPGGLTERGAGHLIDNSSTARASYRAIRDDVVAELKRLRTTTDGEVV